MLSSRGMWWQDRDSAIRSKWVYVWHCNYYSRYLPSIHLAGFKASLSVPIMPWEQSKTGLHYWWEAVATVF